VVLFSGWHAAEMRGVEKFVQTMKYCIMQSNIPHSEQ
jgi:hypothetical protein